MRKIKQRRGLKPEFRTIQDLVIASTYFCRAYPKYSILVSSLLGSGSFSSLYDSECDCWSFPDLGKKFNRIWDNYCSDTKNKVVLSNLLKFKEREDRKRRQKFFSIRSK